jgi:hypothetical protein
MPEIRIGSTPVTDFRIGTTQVNELRIGSTLVWTRGGVFRDDFPEDDLDTLVDTGRWADHGPATDHVLGIVDGRARVAIPDGELGGIFAIATSRMRYTVGTLSQNDSYLEVRVATKGSSGSISSLSGYTTDAFHRLSNAAFTHGVGIRMHGGVFRVVSRIASTDATHTPGYNYTAGDRLGLLSVGNVHGLLKNGIAVDVWNDTGATAASGVGYRSMGLRGDGAKDFLGPRQFSPAIDYIQMRAN